MIIAPSAIPASLPSKTAPLAHWRSSSVCMHPSVPVCGTASVLLIGYYSWRATDQMLCCEWGLDTERRLYQRSKYIHTVQVYFYVGYSTSVIICIYVVRVIFIIESWFDKKRLLKWWIIIFLQGDDVIKYRYSKLNYKTSIEALSVKNKTKKKDIQYSLTKHIISVVNPLFIACSWCTK